VHDLKCARRWKRHFEREYPYPWNGVADRYLLCDRARILVLRVNDEEAGFIRLVDQTPEQRFNVTTLGAVWRVSSACVLRKWRGRGVYTTLLRHAAAHADAHMIYLHPAIVTTYRGFYERCGFPHVIHHIKTGMSSAVTPQYWELRARHVSS
jgi:GNAT superfamily N-acetyltransferase